MTRNAAYRRSAAALFRRLLEATLLIAATLAGPVWAQDQSATPDSVRTAAPSDTTSAAPADTSAPPPAPRATASDDRQGLEAPVKFQAEDSLVVRFGEQGGDTGTLYGKATVNYNKAKLEAHSVEMRFDLQELYARGLPSDTGMIGRPRFQRSEEDAFGGSELAYNLGTERGRVVGARTEIEDGLVQGDVVKMMEDSTFFIQDGVYTTCDCGPNETPSYSLRADRMKLQDKWLYTGPIQLYIFNIPTPLWLPFGFLPAIEGRRSGPLPINYGENRYGFYLKNVGWYQVINEYMDLSVSTQFWTSGSFEITPFFRYERRYHYDGDLRLEYIRARQGLSRDPNFTVRSTGKLNWTHSQDFNPSTSFNANVDLQAQGYPRRTIAEDYGDRVKQTIQSTVRFSKRWSSVGRNLRLQLSQNQNLVTDEVNLTLPRLSFSQSSRKPFERERRPAGSDERWYEKIKYNYSGSLTNDYDFQPLPDTTLRQRKDTAAADIAWYEALVSPSKYRRATGNNVPFNFKASHRIPVDASFSIDRIPVLNRRFFLSLTPNLTYTEDWFLYTRRQELKTTDADTTVETNRVWDPFALRQFRGGIDARTEFFGIFPMRVGPFSGLRHIVRPNISYNYQPDFSNSFWGYTNTYTDANDVQQRYPIVNEVNTGERQAISLRLGNVFQTKHVSVVDSTGEEKSRTVKLLNLDFNTSYNFAADRFKLAPLQVRGRTRIWDQVGVNFNANFSPYQLDDNNRRTDRFLWDDGKLPRLTRVGLSINTSLRSGEGGSGRATLSPSRTRRINDSFSNRPGRRSSYDDPYGSSPGGYRSASTDFSIPWSLDLSFNYSLNQRNGDLRLTAATLNTGFNFSLTPKWKIRAQTGYDFQPWEVVPTNIGISRDLGCWEMSFDWTPFGRAQSYGFRLQVKSGKLRDLLRLSQPSSGVENRFEGLLN